MNAAVTGGTGFFGRALLRLLAPQCERVAVLVRQAPDDADMRALGALPVRGDLTDPHGCASLVQSGDTVFHAAARVDMTGGWESFAQTTVEGTRHLLAAALPRKPARFVYVSSAAVYAPVPDERGMSAEHSTVEPLSFNFYARAKLLAENLVRRECARVDCPWVIVRLGFLHGPGNRALLKHFGPMLERKRLYIIGNGQNRIATLYVDDAASAVLAAGMHPAAVNRVYDVASDERVTQRQYVDATAEALSFPPPNRRAPRSVAYAVAGLAEWWARLRGGEPPFTRAMVVLMAFDQVVDASRISAELGWRPEVSFAEGMRRTQLWHRAQQATGPTAGGA
ncbi:MAG: NAD-dependent epimerase/dehydratase family protein [Planctomycetes bacterium]|nr:NAD-dependent epimerase/dehydratase family protein [Planctomycetota bacterium]